MSGRNVFLPRIDAFEHIDFFSGLTSRWSAAVVDKVPALHFSARRAQLKR